MTARAIAAEALGSALLAATVVGSGILGVKLSAGNDGIALLANALATGAVLIALIEILRPVSGAHFNPAVTGVLWWRGALAGRTAAAYVAVQVLGMIAGVVAAHAMFGEALVQTGTHLRSTPGEWLAEAIAAFGLILVVLGSAPATVARNVAVFVVGGYWFTSSTCFANPAITIARSLTATFAGIAPASVAPFVIAQIIGAAVAAMAGGWLFSWTRSTAEVPDYHP